MGIEHTEADETRIQRMCLDLMYGQTRTAWLSNAVCLGLLWFAFWENADHAWMAGWSVSGILIMVLREVQAGRYARRADGPINLIAWTRWMEASLLVNGCFWGIGCAALTLIATPVQLPVILMIACGLQTGSVLASSYLLRAFALFSVPLFLLALVPFVVLGLRGEPSLLVTAALLTSTSLFIMLCASRFGAHHRQSIRYALENGDLAESLKVKVEENQRLNHDLRLRIDELGETQAELLREKQRSDETAREKANFLATMSHEIRTPMNGVLGMAQSLNDSALDDEQRGQVETILTSGRALLTILNDVLDLSKIEAGKLTLDPQPCALPELIEEVGQLLSTVAIANDLRFDTLYAAHLPERVRADDTRLRQVLLNLVGNALKFTQEGSVSLEVDGEIEGDRAQLHIDVCDTGIGIPEDQLDTIFQQFSQAEASTSRRFGGTGLGLSISHALVAAMGGRIEVTSTCGEGSRFRVCLELDVLDSAANARPLKQQLICLVSEDPMLARTVAAHAARAGQQLIQAANAKALEDELSAETRAPVVILWDQSLLPSTGPVPVAPSLADVPIVLLARHRQLGHQQLVELGAARQLIRPLRRRDIVSLVDGGRSAAARPTQSPAAAEATAFNGLRVLVVDDNPINRTVARKMLQKLGMKIEEAGDGVAALEASDQATFDLIFMDVSMPVMDGCEAVERLRERELRQVQSRTPVVALTAHAVAGDQERFLEQGFDSYLAKPLDQQALRETLHQLL